jgi:hypothetical protein
VPAQSRRLSLIAALLVGAVVVVWGPVAFEHAAVGRAVASRADDGFFVLNSDPDVWARSGDQSVVASRYDLRPSGDILGFPRQVGEWNGEDVANDDTAKIGLEEEQHILRSYTNARGELVWFRLVASSDWDMVHHTPAACYSGAEWKLEPEQSYALSPSGPGLQMRGFVARQGTINHLVLYTFLWGTQQREIADGATMVELVAPFERNPDEVMPRLKEFAGLVFADDAALRPAGLSPAGDQTTSDLPQWRGGGLQPDASDIPHRVGATFGDNVTLLGYDTDERDLRPGGTLPVTLYWQARAPVQGDYRVFVHLLGRDRQTSGDILTAQVDRQPFGGLYPTNRWPIGQVVKEVYQLKIPPNVWLFSRGLEVGLYLSPSQSQQRLALLGTHGQPSGDTVFLPLLPSLEKLSVQHPLDASFGGKVKLLGYNLDRPFTDRPGRLAVTLYWQSIAPMDEDYTVFVHALARPASGSAPRMVSQVDRQPFDGRFSTSHWQVGQVVKEVYELGGTPGAAGDEQSLEFGMYQLATKRRLDVLDADGRTFGDSVVVGMTLSTGRAN